MCLREGPQALLQNTPDMPARRQTMMFAMLQCIVLDGAAEHATLLVSLAHQHKCEAVEPKSLAHVVSILSCECQHYHRMYPILHGVLLFAKHATL